MEKRVRELVSHALILVFSFILYVFILVGAMLLLDGSRYYMVMVVGVSGIVWCIYRAYILPSRSELPKLSYLNLAWLASGCINILTETILG